MQEREGNQVGKKEMIFTGLPNFGAGWNIGIYIGKSFFFFFQLFILKRHPVSLNVNILQSWSTISIAGS